MLARLQDLGLIQRRSGYGWEFIHEVRDPRSKAESFRFRMLIEPAALLEPGFALPPGWLEQMRQAHMDMLNAEWTETTSIALFEMNAKFHYDLCAASGNRYIAEAMARQNQLRRIYNYHWLMGPERVRVNCMEHLEILERLERGQREVASAMLRDHIASALRAKPETDPPETNRQD